MRNGDRRIGIRGTQGLPANMRRCGRGIPSYFPTWPHAERKHSCGYCHLIIGFASDSICQTQQNYQQIVRWQCCLKWGAWFGNFVLNLILRWPSVASSDELTWVGLNSTKEKACILQVEDSFLSFLSWLWRGNFKKKSICSHSFIITLFTFTFCSDHLLPAVLI